MRSSPASLHHASHQGDVAVHINFHFENNGTVETEEVWLLNLLSHPSIHSVGHLTLSERGEVLPLLLNGFPYSAADGGGLSLLQILCISILNGGNYLTKFRHITEPELLTAYKVADEVQVSTMMMEDGTCHISIGFSLEP